MVQVKAAEINRAAFAVHASNQNNRHSFFQPAMVSSEEECGNVRPTKGSTFFPKLKSTNSGI
jgi:hypothetical protein